MGGDLRAIAADRLAAPTPSVTLGGVVEPERAGWVLATAYEVEVARAHEVGHCGGNGHEEFTRRVPARRRDDALAAIRVGRFDALEHGAAREHSVEVGEIFDCDRLQAADRGTGDDAAEPLAQFGGLERDGLKGLCRSRV